MKRALLLGALAVAFLPSAARAVPATNLNALWQAAQPGDVIELDAGTYPLQSLYFDPDKASEADLPDVTFKPAPGATVVIQGLSAYGVRNIAFEGLDIAGKLTLGCEDTGIPTNAYGQHDSQVTFRGNHLRNFVFRNLQHALFADNEFGPASFAPIIGGSGDNGGANCTDEAPDDIVFEDNEFHDMIEGSSVSHMECLMIEGGWNIIIRRNTFRGCSVFDLFFKGQLAGGLFGFKDILVENNFFGHPVASPFRSAGTRAISLSQGNYTGVKIRHNSVNASIEVRTDLLPGTYDVLAEGNLSVSRSGSCNVFARNAYLTAGMKCPLDIADGVQSGWVDASDQSSPYTLDFHLLPDSWPIDKASTTIADDIDKDLRVGVNDLGADEWQPPCPPIVAAPFALCKVSETATTITFGWWPVAGAVGYRFYANGDPVSNTWDPMRNSVVFGKADSYRVEALGVIATATG